jgi:hypothetical protein
LPPALEREMKPHSPEDLSIEDIVLGYDRRGISALRPFLPSFFCQDAAQFILDKREAGNRTAIITTGFYIISTQAAETDGPLGAVALGRALEELGFEVVFVTDRYAVPLLSLNQLREARVIEFPMVDHTASQNFAQELLDEIQPAITIAIERCGFTRKYRYLNMRGGDITDFTAKIDYLFLGKENTLGIGDGGNEIGMGKLAAQIRALPFLVDKPAATATSQLVISSVSNWGAYGIVAAMSQLHHRDLLPSVSWERELLQELVARGAVDGISGQNICAVDGFNTEQNSQVLTRLKQLIQRDAI